MLQQKTVNEIRAAIKPAPRPVHSYMVTPLPSDSEISIETQTRDNVQIVEIPGNSSGDEGIQNVEAPQKPIAKTLKDDEGGPDKVGTEGYFFTRKLKKRAKLWWKKGEAEEEDDVPLEQLTGAARRRKIKDAIVKLDDPVITENAYKPRRRLW